MKYQTRVNKTYYTRYSPQNAITQDGSIEWVIPSSTDNYIDLNESLLNIIWSITNEDGTQLAPPDHEHNDKIPDESLVFPINYFGTTYFQQCEIFVNGQSIESLDTLYAYKTFIQTLLSYGYATKRNDLQLALYSQDIHKPDAHTFDDILKDDSSKNNKGAAFRFLSTYMKKFQTIVKFHGDIFNQPKLLMGGVELRIRLQRNNNKFSLMAHKIDKEYKINIEKAELMICHKNISLL